MSTHSAVPPDNDFQFETSDGEQFAMSPTEVADAMAFVRELKAKADKEDSRYTCPKCGGNWDGMTYTSYPIQHKCTSCHKWWTP